MGQAPVTGGSQACNRKSTSMSGRILQKLEDRAAVLLGFSALRLSGKCAHPCSKKAKCRQAGG